MVVKASTGEHSSVSPGEKSYGGHFLHTLSISAHEPKEEFVIPLSLTQGSEALLISYRYEA